MVHRLADVVHCTPFDAIADAYDSEFTGRRLGRWLRRAVHRQLERLVQPGQAVLELGCGTGEDALWLARRGVQVTATDASPAMLEVAARKVAGDPAGEGVTLARLDINDTRVQVPGLTPPYDGVLADFGVLNCLPDRRPLGRRVAEWVRPGGWAALVVMSPVCPWEIAWHALHGRAGAACRRFRSGAEAHVGGGATVPVWYPSPSRLRREFGPHFRPVRTVGIGVLLPPSYLAHLVDRWPGLFSRLAAWEGHLAGRFPWTWLNDHYLLVLERQVRGGA